MAHPRCRWHPAHCRRRSRDIRSRPGAERQPDLTATGLVTALGGGLGMTVLGLVFAFGYLALTIIATVGKLFVPASGLWLHDTGSWSLSFAAMPGAREVPGWWIVPIGTGLVVGGWLALNRLLRLMLRFALPRAKPRAGSHPTEGPAAPLRIPEEQAIAGRDEPFRHRTMPLQRSAGIGAGSIHPSQPFNGIRP